MLLNDYDPKEADDSPCLSFRLPRATIGAVLPTEPVSLGEPLHKYQSIEKDSSFAVRQPYKLHIKDKAKFKALRDNENNMIAGICPPSTS